MGDLEALLAGLADDPRNGLRWLVLADWLEENGEPGRAELLRLNRPLVETCLEPESVPDRAAWQRRVVTLLADGVEPCGPRHTLALPGGVGLTGALIPPGSFLMGEDDPYSTAGPRHPVTLSRGYYLGVHPVTRRQWRAVMGTDPSRHKGDDRPVNGVSTIDALLFCWRLVELTGRAVCLPTEAQREHACRAGTTTEYHYGDVPRSRCMNYDARETHNGSRRGRFRGWTLPVTAFPPNPWGLYGCHGNVREWCLDVYDPTYYARSPTLDPMCSSDWGRGVCRLGYRVCRGGSYVDEPHLCGSAFRFMSPAEMGCGSIGFRVAFGLEEVPAATRAAAINDTPTMYAVLRSVSAGPEAGHAPEGEPAG